MAKVKHSRLQFKKLSTLKLVLFMLTVVLLMFLAMGIFFPPIGDDSDSPPNGLSFYRRHTIEKHNKMEEVREQWTEVISWEPRAFIYHNFLSKAECDYLINLAKPHMVASAVVDSETGQSKHSRVRTSSGMFLRRGQDKIIRNIEKRIADFTFIPVENGEGLHVIHYAVGQQYEPHYDYFLDKFNIKNGGQRMATLLMYLSDVEEGGETVFPHTKANFSSVPWWNELSECGKQGLSLKPKMGDALLFWSMRPNATVDPSSLHEGTNGHVQSGCMSMSTTSELLFVKDLEDIIVSGGSLLLVCVVNGAFWRGPPNYHLNITIEVT